MIRVFAYLRVSSKGQEDGDGYTRQRVAIEKFCAARGWVIPAGGWFAEPISGTVESAERPVFADMMERTGDATTKIVVVENADRLARDLVVSELLISEAEKSGVIIWAANSEQELTNQTDPTRVLIRQLMGALAQWDKCNTVRRLRAARERIRHEKGRCEGTISVWETTRAAEFRVLARWVRDTEMGRELAEVTMDELRKYLTENRVKTTNGKTYWTRQSVGRLMQRIKLYWRLGEKHPMILPRLPELTKQTVITTIEI